MAATSNPFFSFFPALPLSKTLCLGDWCIGYPTDEVRWRSARFKELALTHFKTFENQGFTGGALMWHRERGFDGSMPEPTVWSALRAAVCFVALDANDHVRDLPNAVHYLATSENAELFSQPLDEDQGFISYSTGGSLKRILSGGWKIGESTPHLPDAVVPIERPVIPSQLHATALFDALCDTQHAAHRRIHVALDWHRFALSNPRVVSLAQRLIALKTGFEALSGESSTPLCGAFLRKLFEDVTRPHADALPWPGLLWSPGERTDLQRTYTSGNRQRAVVRSELEDWFATLGEARNEIIHEGTLTVTEYAPPPERPLSRYVGPLFWTADRVLREAVKAMLGVEILLCGRLKEVRLNEQFVAACRALLEEAAKRQPLDDEGAGEPVDVETASPEESTMTNEDPADEQHEAAAPPGAVGTRDLQALLAALNCDAANKVRLEKVVSHSSATLEGADANMRAARGLWSASFAKRSIAVDARERDVLQAAGAEFPMRRYWERCD